MSCEYCRGEKHLVAPDDEIGGIESMIDGDKLIIRFHEGAAFMDEQAIRIGFCPKCGTEITPSD